MLDEAAKARLLDLFDELRFYQCFDQEKPVNEHTKDLMGDTPLHYTVIREDLIATADLLNAGADPNAQGEDDYTPLHYAASRGNVVLIALLLSFGASRESKNYEGRTPADLARTIGGPEAAALIISGNNAPASTPTIVDEDKTYRCIRHELIAEFPRDGSVSSDKIVALESRLRGMFERPDDLTTDNRHQGEMMISVCTFDPGITLVKLLELAEREGIPKSVRVAYRIVGGQEFKHVWP